LSSLDAGYFGKGIYFTTCSMYCLPYISIRRNPAIILSWVIPGNVYPTIEDHRGPNSLLGGPIKAGFNSHFIVASRDGRCLTTSQDEMYNELVVPQESQVVPAFIFTVEKKKV